MESAKLFIDKNLSNPPNPNNVDQIFEISNQFSQIVSNLSDQDKKELNDYVSGIYNTSVEKVKNCVPSQGGKKSRRRKHKKRNTLTRGIKRGGDGTVLTLLGTAELIGVIVLGLMLLAALNNPN